MLTSPNWLNVQPLCYAPNGDYLGFADKYAYKSSEGRDEELMFLIDTYGEGSQEVARFESDNPWWVDYDDVYLGPYDQATWTKLQEPVTVGPLRRRKRVRTNFAG